MKKRILALLLSVLCPIGILAGCSSDDESTTVSDSQETVYNIEEFGKLYDETYALVSEEAEYLTNDELYGDEGESIMKNASEKTGFPLDERITIRGKKERSFGMTDIQSTDGLYSVACFFSEDNDPSIFIENGENIVVSGVASSVSDSGAILSDCQIVSPENVDTSYQNDVAEKVQFLSSVPEYKIISGEVVSILSSDDFKTFASGAGFSLSEYAVLYDSVAEIAPDNDEDCYLFFSFSEDIYDNLEKGDKITIDGEAYSLYSDSSAGYYGMIDTVFDIYFHE